MRLALERIERRLVFAFHCGVHFERRSWAIAAAASAKHPAGRFEGGSALLDLGRVSEARRLGSAAIDLLVRAGAPGSEVAAARELLGHEVPVGEPARGKA